MRRITTTLAVALMATAAWGSSLSGSLDATFGTDGITDLGSDGSSTPPSYILDFAEQGTSRIYLAATGSGTTSRTLLVGRIAASGAEDTSFGVSGRTELSVQLGSGTDALAVDGSGRIYIAGRFADGDVVRLTMDGAVDTSWGSGGYADVSTLNVENLVLTTLGDVIAIGTTTSTKRGNSDWGAVRFDGSTGEADSTFGRRGLFKAGVQMSSPVVAAAIDSEDRVLLAGQGTYADYVVVRMTSDGEIDTSFGVAAASASATTQTQSTKKKGGGKGGGGGGDSGGDTTGGVITLAVDGASIFDLAALHVDINDDFYVSGTVDLGSTAGMDPFIAHYSANGILDTAFGNGQLDGYDGIAYPDMPGDQFGRDLIVDAGAIVQCGHSAPLIAGDLYAWRYDITNGEPDSTFGPDSDGISEPGDLGIGEWANAITIDDGGDILVGGFALEEGSSPMRQFMILARYCW